MVRYKDNQKKRLKGKGVTKLRRKTESSSFWNPSPPADAAAVQQLQARVAELEAEVSSYKRNPGKGGNCDDNRKREPIPSPEQGKSTNSGAKSGAAVEQSEGVTCSLVFDRSGGISVPSSQKQNHPNLELDNTKTVHGDCARNQVIYEELGEQVSTSSTDLSRENQRLEDEATELRSSLADRDRQITASDASRVLLRSKVDEQAEVIELCNISIENSEGEVIRLRRELDFATEDAAEKDKLILALQKSSAEQNSEMQRLKQSVENLDQHICVLSSSETTLRTTIEVQDGIIRKTEEFSTNLIQERDAAILERDAAVQKRDATMKERDEAIKERDVAIKERDVAIKEREDKENTIDMVLNSSKLRTAGLQRDHTQHLEKMERENRLKILDLTRIHQSETQKLQYQVDELQRLLADRHQQVQALETRQERLLLEFQDFDSITTGKRGAKASTQKQFKNRDMVCLTSELLTKMVSLLQKFRSIHSSSILRRQESLIGLPEPLTNPPEALSSIHKKLGETLTVMQHWKVAVDELYTKTSQHDKNATKGQEKQASIAEKSSSSKNTAPLRLKPILSLSPSKSQRSLRSSVRGRSTTSEIHLRRSKRSNSRSRSRDRTKRTKVSYDGKLSYDGRTLNLRNHLQQTVLSINSDEETN